MSRDHKFRKIKQKNKTVYIKFNTMHTFKSFLCHFAIKTKRLQLWRKHYDYIKNSAGACDMNIGTTHKRNVLIYCTLHSRRK